MDNSKHLPKGTLFLISIFIIIFILDKIVLKGILFEWGALKKDAVLIKREYWRVITASFFHGGIIHILANIIGLYCVGRLLEREIGSVGLNSIFIIGNIITNILFMVTYSFESSIGGSPGIYALIGVVLILCFKEKKLLETYLHNRELDSLIVYFIAGNFKGLDALFVHSVGFSTGIIISMLCSKVR
ncbi:rhomboid family intramembrane serine protease [Inediibacterium massiliense]|uniref:rhomboid family intramembrane serine protease n=1 Tax=Inediibacterium massiliense TaxID=1658111 RepID=UPI0006B6108F|nr:rhomboid family intramembrane serine protease [Inediibacterium massiliense]